MARNHVEMLGENGGEARARLFYVPPGEEKKRIVPRLLLQPR